MNPISNFAFDEQLIRVIERNDEPWFVLNDVCRVLEHTNSRVASQRLDDDEKGVTNVYTLGGSQEVVIINESGLYSLVLTSRKPEAKRFKKWVTASVLPAIRKTGSYRPELAPPPRSADAPWPVDETARKIAMVTEARMTHGATFAQRLWSELGLPEPQKQLAQRVDEQALLALAHLLNTVWQEKTIREWINAAYRSESAAKTALKDLKIELKGDGFIVPLVNRHVAEIFENTPWPRPFEFFRRLPGTKPTNPWGGRHANECTWIPSNWLNAGL